MGLHGPGGGCAGDPSDRRGGPPRRRKSEAREPSLPSGEASMPALAGRVRRYRQGRAATSIRGDVGLVPESWKRHHGRTLMFFLLGTFVRVGTEATQPLKSRPERWRPERRGRTPAVVVGPVNLRSEYRAAGCGHALEAVAAVHVIAALMPGPSRAFASSSSINSTIVQGASLSCCTASWSGVSPVPPPRVEWSYRQRFSRMPRPLRGRCLRRRG